MSNINNSYVKQQNSRFKSNRDNDLNCDIETNLMNKKFVSPNDVLQLKLPTKSFYYSFILNIT